MSDLRYIDSSYYGSSYTLSSNYKSEIFLMKGEQAHLQPANLGGSTKYVNNWTNCKSVDNEAHSCTWLEIRKTGDPIA